MRMEYRQLIQLKLYTRSKKSRNMKKETVQTQPFPTLIECRQETCTLSRNFSKNKVIASQSLTICKLDERMAKIQ